MSSAAMRYGESAIQAGSPILRVTRLNDTGVEPYPPHAHPEALLLWTAGAMVSVSVTGRDWLVPPGFGVWIPGNALHSVTTVRLGEMEVLNIDSDRDALTCSEPTGFRITALIREVLTSLGPGGAELGVVSRAHAESLLFSVLEPLEATTLHLTMPSDDRARRVAEALLDNPADTRDLAAWACTVHAGERTLSRLFTRQTGMTFAQWRLHARVGAAVRRLALGATVNATARAVGYRTTGSFIEAFERVTGQTPANYRS